MGRSIGGDMIKFRTVKEGKRRLPEAFMICDRCSSPNGKFESYANGQKETCSDCGYVKTEEYPVEQIWGDP